MMTKYVQANFRAYFSFRHTLKLFPRWKKRRPSIASVVDVCIKANASSTWDSASPRLKTPNRPSKHFSTLIKSPKTREIL